MQASIDFDGTLTGSIAGGGGGGSDVSITPTYHQGTKIADYSIDGNDGAIYTPEIEISKNVLSGVKICEIEGVEIFAPSYGYFDTLGDSNVEQIGGFSQGLNVTPVKVKRVSYTNDVSNGEKIGTLIVGDTSYNVYQKPNTNINYSTTEQDTGRKWIDGNEIYQITFVYTTSSTLTGGMYTINNFQYAKNVMKAEAFTIENGVVYIIPYVADAGNATFIFRPNGNIDFNVSNNTSFGAGSQIIYTLFYTKVVTS